MSVLLLIATMTPSVPAGAIARVSMNRDGTEGDGGSDAASASADRRFAAFSFAAASLASDDA